MSLEGIVALILGFSLGLVCGLRAGPVSMASQVRLLSQMARVDALTGLLNRRAFEEHLAELDAVAQRYGQGFSLLMIDLDHFKSLNDRAGHPAGDAALRQIAAMFREQVREADRVFRIGGDEFAILCPCTPAEGAMVLAERLRASVTTLSIPQLRFSAGIAEASGSATAADDGQADIVQRADAALMTSKRAGGDQVQVEPAVPE